MFSMQAVMQPEKGRPNIHAHFSQCKPLLPCSVSRAASSYPQSCLVALLKSSGPTLLHLSREAATDFLLRKDLTMLKSFSCVLWPRLPFKNRS